MPDWITHLGVGWLLLEALRRKERRLFFLLGCVLPDVEKVYVVAGFFASPRFESVVQAFFQPTHTAVGALLLSVTSTALFRTERDEDFGKAAASIFSGAILHLALDSLIEVEASGGIEFLWPLTSAGFSISLIELGDWRPAVVVATACVAVALLKRRRGRS